MTRLRVVTWLGTRPEIIRLSRIIPLLDQHCDHRLVYTGQNYDPNLRDIFFRELGVREPDADLGIRSGDFGTQAGAVIDRAWQYFTAERPDRVLILGDTNSGLAAIAAARLRIPVFHMEAGNRCYDDRVPEEINRRIIDHSSAILLPYTHRSKEHLLREGFDRRRIHVTGNPIYEVLTSFETGIAASGALGKFGVERKGYLLATLHRSENVDEEGRLRLFAEALTRVTAEHRLPMILSLHPRTADRMKRYGIALGERVIVSPPLGFFDFVHLQKNALCVLSDSGTVQEEACIFGVPNVTLRDVTERGETVECGSNILTGADPEAILRGVAMALSGRSWTVPPEYLEPAVSQTVARMILGYAA